MKFTQEIKDKWLTALRSGDYRQGQQRLYTKDKNTFCCLGVLGLACGVKPENMKYSFFRPVESGDDAYSPNYPTMFTVTRLDACGDQWKGTIAGVLATMNDQGKPFTEIADYIEKNIPTEA